MKLIIPFVIIIGAFYLSMNDVISTKIQLIATVLAIILAVIFVMFPSKKHLL